MQLARSAIALAAIACVTMAQDFTLVAPNGYAATEGASNNGFPWNRGTGPMHYMQVFDSSNFTGPGATGSLLIQRLRFRADAAAQAAWAGGTYGSVDMYMSTCAVDHTAITTTFANNHGLDRVQVRSGSFTIGGGVGNGAGNPGPWHVDVVLQRPFVYDPANGDLVFEVQLDGATYGGGTLVQCDAVSSGATPSANGSRLFSSTSATNATGTLGIDYSLLCEFTYQRMYELPTIGLGGNFNSSGGGVHFDLDVKAPEGVVVKALGINTQEAAGNAGTLDVYVRRGTHNGFEQSPIGWRQVATAVPYLAAGSGVETNVAFAPFGLSPGTWGFCVVATHPTSGFGQNYTNGNNVYSDSALTLTTGTATNVALAPGVVNSPRTWNGSIYYDLAGRKLPTILASNNSNSPGGGNYFDVFVRHNAGVRVTALEIHSQAPAGTPDTLSIWSRPGTVVGNEQTTTGWIQHAAGIPYVSGGFGQPSLVVLPYPLFLEPGTNGIAIGLGTAGFFYTNGTGTNETYTDPVLDVIGRSSSNVFLAAGPVFTPRVWNGVLHYQVLDPDLLQFQFNDLRGSVIGNSANNSPAPYNAAVSNTGWQAGAGRPYFGANEPGVGVLGIGAINNNRVTTGFPLAIANDDLTVMWWQRMGAAPAAALAYSFGGAGGNPRIFTGGVAGTTLLYRGSTIGDVSAVVNTQASPGNWQHCALVVNDDAGIARWYVDGQLTNQVAFAPNTHTATSTGMNVAWHQTTGDSYTEHYEMDDFRVYRRALTPMEVMIALESENPSSSSSGTTCGAGVISSTGGLPSIQSGNPRYLQRLTGATPGQFFANVVGLFPLGAGIVDLSPLIGAGCTLQTQNLVVTIGVVSPAGEGYVFGPIPRDPTLRGLHCYTQFLVGPIGGAGAATRLLDVNLQ